MKLSPVIAGILCSGLFFLASAQNAQSAEIININYKYRIAFADLTENDVKAGELVTVTTPDGLKVLLKVVETYPVMAKLTVPDEEGTLTDEQFAAIPVGSQVVAGGKSPAARSKRPVAKPARPVTVATDDTDAPTHVEQYVPSVTGGAGVKATDPDSIAAERSATTVAVAPNLGSSAGQLSGAEGRCALLDQRLDQMMSHNVKLAENITQILSEKNAAESRTREKEAEVAAVRAKADELARVNAALVAQVRGLEASVASIEEEKAAKQKEIENLNLKLGELKKKLAKMVEIVNTNMKAYEKQ